MLAAQLRREVMRGRLVLLSEAGGSQDSPDPHRLFRWRVLSIKNASNGRSGGGAICAGVRRVTRKGDCVYRGLPMN